MHGHLVTVKVRIKGGTDKRVQLDRLAFDKRWLKGLNTEPVQRWCTVEHNRVFADHLFENVPDLRALLFHHALSRLNGRDVTIKLQLSVDKGLKQLQRHFLR